MVQGFIGNLNFMTIRIIKMFYQWNSLSVDNEVIDTTKMNISLSTHIILILDMRKVILSSWGELFNMAEEIEAMMEQPIKDYCDITIVSRPSLWYQHNERFKDHLSEQREKTLVDITHNIKGSIELVL